MPSHRMLHLSLVTAALIFCSFVAAQEIAPAPRIVDRIDDSNLVTLHGNTHPSARAQNDRGRVNPDLRMDGLVLVLKRSPEQQAEFDALVASQTDPDSPDFHRWLQPEEVGERFGPAQADIEAIESWLRDHGLNVGTVSADRMTIHFGGSAGQMEETFHTEIHNLDVHGERHIANMTDPKIPAALAPVVAGPKALHNFIPRPLHRLGSKVTYDRERGGWRRVPGEPATNASRSDGQPAEGRNTSTPKPLFGVNDTTNQVLEEDVSPYDFATIYNVLPAWNKGFDGTGQTIAIAGTSEISASDLATFRKAFGLPAIKSFTQVVANGINPGVCTSPVGSGLCTLDDLTENSLDVEWSTAVAKGASVVLVVSGNNSSGTIDTVLDSAQYVVNHKTAPILNVSYGLCELAEGDAGNQVYNNLWQTAQSEGIGVFVATGDSGAATCDALFDGGAPYVAEYGLSVSGIASTPYNTAVGGTDFYWCDPITSSNCTGAPYWGSGNSSAGANAQRYIPEIPWNDSCASKVGIEAAGYWDNQLYESGEFSGLPNTPQDGEQACNFYYDWDSTIDNPQLGGPDLDFLLDVSGGGGGRSACTTNNTTASSTSLDPSSCGGGYGKPSWQAGVTGIPADGHRDLPDVSFFASNGFLSSAYLICVSAKGACSYSATDAATTDMQEIGGTSASSPAMAGVMAILNQKAGAPWGNPNAELYTLASKQNYADCSTETVSVSSGCYFNDIDTQNISVPCDHKDKSPNCQDLHSDDIGTLGWGANRGFDLATGLGSLNVANVVNAWPATPLAAVSLSSTSLTFAATVKGVTSAAQTIVLKNTGKASLTLNSTGEGIKITGKSATSFSQTNTCGSSVAAGASCAIKVAFKPVSSGSFSASISVADNATGSPQSVALKGTGIAAALSLSSGALKFAGTTVGHTSVKQEVTLKNLSGAALGITHIGVSGANPVSFVQTNTCGASIAGGKSCVISVAFRPQKVGSLSAEVLITDKASSSPHTIMLSGTGTGAAVVSLSSTSLAFPATTVNNVVRKSFTLTNKGNAKLLKPGGGIMVTLTGANSPSFSQTNDCNAGVAPGAKCTVTVAFKPRKTGDLSAEVEFTDNAPASPQIVKLSGTGK